MFQIHRKYYDEDWFQPVARHLSLGYPAIEGRFTDTFYYVTPSTENRSTYSYVYASILRDVGSAFDSVVRKLIIETGDAYDHSMHGYLKFLVDFDQEFRNRTVLMRYNRKSIIPFKKDGDGLPKWWHAYNAVKHDEVINFSQGNLENSLTSVAALAILNFAVARSGPV